MIAFFDTKEKVDFLINFATILCEENMEDYVFLNFVPAYRKLLNGCEVVLCLNFKHRLSKDVVHIALSLTHMKAAFCEGEARVLVSDLDVPKSNVLWIYFDYWKNLVLETRNFSFLAHWKDTPQKCFLFYALFTINPNIFKASLDKRRIKPALYNLYFGYLLETFDNKNNKVFMRAEHKISENPYVFLYSPGDLRVLSKEPWEAPLLQPSNKNFWYFNGVKLLRREGLYLTEEEAQSLLRERGIDEYVTPYRHPLPIYMQNSRYWVVASKNNASERTMLLLELFTGEFKEVSYPFFCEHARLALANDNAFFRC